MRLSWLQSIVAFLAGYGLMSLLLWLFAGICRVRGRPLTVSVILAAGRDAARIEGTLRACHRAWEEGRIAETLVLCGESEAETRAIAARLCAALPGLRLLPEGAALVQALAEATGQALWMVDLAKVPADAAHELLPPGVCLFSRRPPDRERIGSGPRAR